VSWELPDKPVMAPEKDRILPKPEPHFKGTSQGYCPSKVPVRCGQDPGRMPVILYTAPFL
jgi:hypothetical protein